MGQLAFGLPSSQESGGIISSLRAFREFGRETISDYSVGVPYFINEFWTSRQRQAHRIHEVSYRACFKPQLPRFFIDRLTNPGDVVHDPFSGRGTTPVEAAIRGRIPFANDTNPLSRALTEPRINPPDLSGIADRLREIPWGSFRGHERDDLLAFYHPDVLAHVEGLRGWLIARERDGSMDQADRWIRMVAINRLTGHSPGFFSVYTLPPNQATSVARQARINERRNQVPPVRDVAGIILKKSRSLLSDGPVRADRRLFLTEQSHETRAIDDGAVALTVTSPPFLDIVDYEADNWLRCWFLGVDPRKVRIDRHRDVGQWEAFVGRTLEELARVTRPGGHVAFEVGEVRNGSVRLEEHVIAAARGLPLRPLAVIVNQQEFTKTSNCWGVSNNTGGTNNNRIVLLGKDT